MISAEKPKFSSSSSSEIIGVVNAAYSARAREGVSSAYASNVAKAFGYTEDQLKSVPEAAHMGLSCGNPIATASIKEGETVVDLGSGGGIDVFLAAYKAGPTGKIIGIDMSSDMISLARKNALKKGLNSPHVAFVEALLTEALPIESSSVDCVLSNCVINLLPMEGKANLLKEVHRILKPGGRVVLDDIVAKKQLPDNILTDLAAYVGCISGAILEEEYKALMKCSIRRHQGRS
jgi:ubiquinone/menaquinone biosynthesis C-methylase UbiE